MADSLAHNPSGKRFLVRGHWVDDRPEDPREIQAIYFGGALADDLMAAIHAGQCKPIIGTPYGTLELAPKIRRVTQRMAVEG